MKTRILHIAFQNVAGLPSTFVDVEQKLGFDSLLVTLTPHPHKFENGLCLNYPFMGESWIRLFKTILGWRERYKAGLSENEKKEIPPVWRPGNTLERLFFNLRDQLYKKIVRKSGVLELLDRAHIVVLDGGLGLLRSGEFEVEWAKRNGRLVSVFYGSDLRSRGVISGIDAHSSLHFTLEFDHLKIHPRAKYIFYPFDPVRVPPPPYTKGKKVRVGHSPTKRDAKGTSKILKALSPLVRKGTIEFVLIENLPYKKAVELQSTCHIFIDQLGELGYGISGLQALCMGIPTIVSLTPEHEAFLGDHPFVRADENDLVQKVMMLVENESLRRELGEKGAEWVRRVHNPISATKSIIEEYEKKGWV